jgi:hypothetical protein
MLKTYFSLVSALSQMPSRLIRKRELFMSYAITERATIDGREDGSFAADDSGGKTFRVEGDLR